MSTSEAQRKLALQWERQKEELEAGSPSEKQQECSAAMAEDRLPLAQF